MLSSEEHCFSSLWGNTALTPCLGVHSCFNLSLARLPCLVEEVIFLPGAVLLVSVSPCPLCSSRRLSCSSPSPHGYSCLLGDCSVAKLWDHFFPFRFLIKWGKMDTVRWYDLLPWGMGISQGADWREPLLTGACVLPFPCGFQTSVAYLKVIRHKDLPSTW